MSICRSAFHSPRRSHRYSRPTCDRRGSWSAEELQLEDTYVCLPQRVEGLPALSAVAGGDVHSLALGVKGPDDIGELEGMEGSWGGWQLQFDPFIR